MKCAVLCLAIVLASLTALGQNPTQAQPSPASGQPVAASTPAAQAAAPKLAASEPPATKPRVFLQSQSKGNNANAARDQSMEMSRDFEEVCPAVRVTITQQMADYTVLLNHIEIGLFVRDNQFQLADKDGDLLSKTKEGGSIRGGVKKVCDLILADWAKGKGQVAAAAPDAPAPSSDTVALAQQATTTATTELTFISTPDGADIELDGAFVGSAPSTVSVANGDHTVRITKKGYRPYEKKLRTSGGTVSLRADLDVIGQ